jgi:hypothetical protein
MGVGHGWLYTVLYVEYLRREDSKGVKIHGVSRWWCSGIAFQGRVVTTCIDGVIISSID